MQKCLKSEKVLNFDQFGKPIMFNFFQGEEVYRSAQGACLSLLIVILTLSFTVQQFIALTNYNDTDFKTWIEYEFYEDNYVVSYEQDDFQIAFAIIDS